MSEQYKHAEAFRLMKYLCEDIQCMHREVIWNSRDGVTPFGFDCPSCGGMIKHADWRTDELAPNHKLHNRQKFWRDGTVGDAIEIIERRLAGRDVPAEIRERLREHARNLTGEFQPGWPMLDTHDTRKP